jgi:hypothetical protein
MDIPNEIISYIGQNFIDQKDISNYRIINKAFLSEALNFYKSHKINFIPSFFTRFRSYSNAILFSSIIKKYKPHITNIFIVLPAWAILADYDLITFVNMIKALSTTIPYVKITLDLINLEYEHLIVILTELCYINTNCVIVNLFINLNTFPENITENEFQKLDKIICQAYENDIIDIKYLQVHCSRYALIANSNFIKYLKDSIEIRVSYYNIVQDIHIDLEKISGCNNIILNINNSDKNVKIIKAELVKKIITSSSYTYSDDLIEIVQSNPDLSQIECLHFYKDLTRIRFEVLSEHLVKFHKLKTMMFNIINEHMNTVILTAILVFYEKTKFRDYIIIADNVSSYCIARIICAYIENILGLRDIYITLAFDKAIIPCHIQHGTIRDIINSLKTESDFHHSNWLPYTQAILRL